LRLSILTGAARNVFRPILKVSSLAISILRHSAGSRDDAKNRPKCARFPQKGIWLAICGPHRKTSAMKINKTYDRNQIRHLDYSFNETPFGEVLAAWNDRGICAIIYVTACEDKAECELRERFPRAMLRQTTDAVNLFACGDVTLNLVGTPFEILVWTALLEVPVGARISYARLARELGCPKSVKAVAAAVERNPIGYIIPCHRVVRNDGSDGEYRFGGELRKAVLEYEKAVR